jgi:hypothetical protein
VRGAGADDFAEGFVLAGAGSAGLVPMFRSAGAVVAALAADAFVSGARSSGVVGDIGCWLGDGAGAGAD